MNEGFTVRRAGPDDVAEVRATRLAALQDAPGQFASTYEEEAGWTMARWLAFLADGAVFLLEDESGPCGLVVGAPHREDPSTTFLLSMWVHPDQRGRGAGDALVNAVVSEARRLGSRRVLLHVVEGNAPAHAFYERNGFRDTGETITGERGQTEHAMALPLQAGAAAVDPPAAGGPWRVRAERILASWFLLKALSATRDGDVRGLISFLCLSVLFFLGTMPALTRKGGPASLLEVAALVTLVGMALWWLVELAV